MNLLQRFIVLYLIELALQKVLKCMHKYLPTIPFHTSIFPITIRNMRMPTVTLTWSKLKTLWNVCKKLQWFKTIRVLFNILLILSTSWILLRREVDADIVLRTKPVFVQIHSVLKDQQMRRCKEDVQEVKRKLFCQLVSRIPSMTRNYTDGNDMVDVTLDKDNMILDRNSRKRKLYLFADNISIVCKKKCFVGSECDYNGNNKCIKHHGKTTNLMQYSFLYANFHQTSINVGSFVAYPTTPMREEIRLGNTRAMLVDGVTNSIGHNNADNPPVDLGMQRIRIRVRSGISESLSSVIASRTSSGFTSLNVYDNDSFAPSNNRNDLPLASGLSSGQRNYQSSGYESYRHSRHVRSGQFSFSLELQADRENDDQQFNNSNLSGNVSHIDPSHSSGLPAGNSYSGGVSCFESINEEENENYSMNHNAQMNSRYPESTRPVHRTAHSNGYATGINYQPHREVSTVSLRDNTERKETESSTSTLTGNLFPFDVDTRSQSSCPAHGNVQQDQDRPAQDEVRSSFSNITHTGYTENATNGNVPPASAPNENPGNMDQLVSCKTHQVFSAGTTTGQQSHKSSCGHNEHSHSNGNQFGSYNRLHSQLSVQPEPVRGVPVTGEQQTLNHVDQQTSMENNQDVIELPDDVLFGEGQPDIPNFDLINDDDEEEEEEEEDRNLCAEVEENAAEI